MLRPPSSPPSFPFIIPSPESCKKPADPKPKQGRGRPHKPVDEKPADPKPKQGRGRPRIDKPVDPKPKRGRGRPPKITRSLDAAAHPDPYFFRQCSNFVERAHSHIKEVVDIRNRLKRTAEGFQPLMSSSSSLDTYGKMINGCLDTYNRAKESFVKVQNAYEDFNGTFRVYLRVKPPLAGETLVKFDVLNDLSSVTSLKTTSIFEKLNHVFLNNESQGN
ncbi:B3 domain-containing transcription factor VRN1-like protein [Tanacetum coccineum]